MVEKEKTKQHLQNSQFPASKNDGASDGSMGERASAGDDASHGDTYAISHQHGKLFDSVLFLNAAGIATGVWFYWTQLTNTPLYLWPFVPDCPFYIFLASLSLLGIVRSKTFDLIVSLGMVKYALWTLFVIFYSLPLYTVFPYILPTLVLVPGHFGMALEGALMYPKKFPKIAILAFLLLSAIDLYFDYAVGVHPPLVPGTEEITMQFTLGISLLLALLAAGGIMGKIAGLKIMQKLRALLL
jgi:uncharacterized membrane protein YpjA